MDDEFVKWDDRYSVGISKIDLQHKKLIEFTNYLYNACRVSSDEANEQFKQTIKKSVEYVMIHFKTEEDLMIKYNYHDFLIHKKEHTDFIKQILEETYNFENNKLFIPNKFVRYLKDWLLSHIAITDNKYKDFFHSKGLT
jgi:hemerythrin